MRAYGTSETVEVKESLEERLTRVENLQAAAEKDLSARFLQAEIRQRNTGKQDIQAAIRGHLVEMVSNVESNVTELIRKEVDKRLQPYIEIHEQSQKQVKDLVAANNEKVKADRADIIKSFEDLVTTKVLKVLQDYWVLDSEMHVLDALQRPVTCRFCETIVTARGEDNGAETR